MNGCFKLKAKANLNGCEGVPLSLNRCHVCEHLYSVGTDTSLSICSALPPAPGHCGQSPSILTGTRHRTGSKAPEWCRKTVHWLWLRQTSQATFSLGLPIFNIGKECGLMISMGPSNSKILQVFDVDYTFTKLHLSVVPQ